MHVAANADTPGADANSSMMRDESQVQGDDDDGSEQGEYAIQDAGKVLQQKSIANQGWRKRKQMDKAAAVSAASSSTEQTARIHKTNKDVLCRAIRIGEVCRFGDACKYSHDVEKYKSQLLTKPSN
jgi:hypothetical protein